jgi:nickel transport protein
MLEKRFFWGQKLSALWVRGIFLLLTMGIFTTPALAHRVLVFAYAEGDTIHTESKFVPATPVRQGEIQVLEEKTGKVLLSGKTDDRGKFSFKIPPEAPAQKMDLKIVVEAAMGHRGEWLLKASSYLPGAKAAAAAPASAAPSPAAPGTKTAAVDPQMLEEAVNKALERQLGPIKEKLAEMAVHRTSLPDIIGGLGYILGFFGLWAYFQSKRKKDF